MKILPLEVEPLRKFFGPGGAPYEHLNVMRNKVQVIAQDLVGKPWGLKTYGKLAMYRPTSLRVIVAGESQHTDWRFDRITVHVSNTLVILKVEQEVSYGAVK
jgi:hypothetical protein